jgi:hypothetical protein
MIFSGWGDRKRANREGKSRVRVKNANEKRKKEKKEKRVGEDGE